MDSGRHLVFGFIVDSDYFVLLCRPVIVALFYCVIFSAWFVVVGILSEYSRRVVRP